MNAYLKIVFNLPVIVYNAIVPINAKTYRPSTEKERKDSEEMRNAIRLADYRIKKFLFAPTKD